MYEKASGDFFSRDVPDQVLRVSMEEQRQRQEDEARRAMQQQGGSQEDTGECISIL